jgi:hypothetical protein
MNLALYDDVSGIDSLINVMDSDSFGCTLQKAPEIGISPPIPGEE